MKRFGIILAVIAVLLIVIFVYGLNVYNSLVLAQESVNTQWSQMETQYQRRYDLVPNLVSSVKGVLTQEQEIFGKIAEARTQYGSATTPEQKTLAADQLESSLSRLLVIVENYPQLRSTETVQTLMSQLEGTENRISVERQRYNDAVRSFNLNLRTFPRNVIARILGFGEKPYFNATPAAQTVVPQVNLELNK